MLCFIFDLDTINWNFKDEEEEGEDDVMMRVSCFWLAAFLTSMQSHVLVLALFGSLEAAYTQIPGETCGLQNGFPKIGSRKRRDTSQIEELEDLVEENIGSSIIDLQPYNETDTDDSDAADLRIVGGTKVRF